MREMPEISKTAYSSSSSSMEPSTSDESQHAFMEIQEVEEGEVEDMRRIVQVFIADINEDIPLEFGLLYTGEATFTDLTDEELFFEIGMKELLDKHNIIRAETKDKKATKESGRDVYLEPARIRDLKMVVVDIADF